MNPRQHPPLVLEGNITIDGIDEIKRLVDDRAPQAIDLVIDASAVSRLDTAGFQLLLACAHRSMEFDCAFECINPSETLLAGMRQLGFAADFSARSMTACGSQEQS